MYDVQYRPFGRVVNGWPQGDPAIPVFFGQLFAYKLQRAQRAREAATGADGAAAAAGTTLTGGCFDDGTWGGSPFACPFDGR